MDGEDLPQIFVESSRPRMQLFSGGQPLHRRVEGLGETFREFRVSKRPEAAARIRGVPARLPEPEPNVPSSSSKKRAGRRRPRA